MQSFKEVKAELSKYATSHSAFKRGYNLSTMRSLMAALGNPQERYKVIHVAGTSGKTSTCYYIASLLGQAGVKVGLTVSPHIDEINERVQINLQPLDEDTFCREFAEFTEKVNKLSLQPSYFELLVAFAFWEFARQAVDYAVVEVGLGGLLDGTNVIDRPDKICVLTDIGTDHAEILGDTIEKIALQKAGIIKKQNTVFAYDQGSAVTGVFKNRAKECKADLRIVPSSPVNNNHMPLFQQRNWQLAFGVYDFLVHRDGLLSLNREQINASQNILIPARMEEREINEKLLIMDGSHNAQKIESLVKSYVAKYGSKRCVVLMALMQDKQDELDSIMRLIAQIADYIIVTKADAQQDIQKRSVEPETIVKAAEKYGLHSESMFNPQAAYEALLRKPNDMLLITGSFYLLNNVRPIMRSRA